MNIFITSPHQDTGGQAARIARAFKLYEPDWSVRAMRVQDNFLHHPADLNWDIVKAERLYQQADVVHHQNGLHHYVAFDKGQHKPTVMHHQGTRLRGHPVEVTDEGLSIGAIQLVSTVDLLADCPGSTWLPQPVNIDEVMQYRVTRPKKVLRIGHSPTNRKAKNTEGILAALNSLSSRYPFEVDLIEGVEWAACLSRKGRCDIFIDQLTLGYGNSGIEAMAMGIPLVSGWDDPSDRERYIHETGTTPQFLEATTATLASVIEPLLASLELREEYGRRGRAFVEMVHEDRRVVQQLKYIYQNVPASTGPLRPFSPSKEQKWTANRVPSVVTKTVLAGV